MELIEGSETSANHNRTPGKYPKEYIKYSKHGESLKSRQQNFIMFIIVLGQHVSILVESSSGPSKTIDPYLEMF